MWSEGIQERLALVGNSQWTNQLKTQALGLVTSLLPLCWRWSLPLQLLLCPTTHRNTETASRAVMRAATNAACFTQHNDEHRSGSTRIKRK